MRWDELFGDLVGQARAAEQDELRGWLDERSREELGRVALAERARAAGTRPVHLDLVDGEHLDGTLIAVGDGWLSVRSVLDDVVVPRAAVARLRLAATDWGSGTAASTGAESLDLPLQPRIGLRMLVRQMARSRCQVRLAMLGGGRTAGTVDGVGADHLELAEHPTDRPRRAGEVRGVALVPFESLLWLRHPSDRADGAE
jgi:hypothetical protein